MQQYKIIDIPFVLLPHSQFHVDFLFVPLLPNFVKLLLAATNEIGLCITSAVFSFQFQLLSFLSFRLYIYTYMFLAIDSVIK